MTERVLEPTEVFFFLEDRSPEQDVLRMSLTHHPAEYISLEVSTYQLTQLTGLYSLAPDTFRQLMNTLVNAAYHAGLTANEEAIVASRRAQFQVIENDILKHEPGSGVAGMHFPSCKGDIRQPDASLEKVPFSLRGLDSHE